MSCWKTQPRQERDRDGCVGKRGLTESPRSTCRAQSVQRTIAQSDSLVDINHGTTTPRHRMNAIPKALIGFTVDKLLLLRNASSAVACLLKIRPCEQTSGLRGNNDKWWT